MVGPETLQQGVQVRLRGPHAPEDEAGPSQAEENALRYFASVGDRPRVEAELAKLRDRFPDWEPPEDLFGPVATIDERPIWALYEAGEPDEALAMIEQLAKEHADWEPPAELLDLIEEKRVRARLSALEEDGQWSRLIETSTAHPNQTTCRRIDNAWRLARAHAELSQVDQAFAVYAGLVQACEDPDHRFATLQKARAKLDWDRFERLLQLEADHPKSAREAKRIEALSARPVQADPALARLYRPNPTLEIARHAAPAVKASRDAGGAEILGWTYFNAGELDQAEAWFTRGYSWRPNASQAEGLARTLGRLGRLDEVETLERKWPHELDGITREARSTRLAQAFEEGDHRTVLALAATLDGVPAALGFRGWTLLRLERPTEAEAAFGQVLKASDATRDQRSEAVFGLARSALALGNVNRAEGLVRIHDLPDRQRHELLAEIIGHKANQAFSAGDYRTAAELYEVRRHYAQPSRGLLMQEAWARYHLGQKSAAARIFVHLDRIQRTPETAAALAEVARYLDGFTF